MYYALITFLTFIKQLLAVYLLGLQVFEPAPYTLRLWGCYLAFAMLLWLPLLFTDRRRWTYVLNMLLDVWLIGNLLYFRSYGDLLNRWCLMDASNMDGIWDAVLPFFRWQDIIFVLLTVVWIVLSEFVTRQARLPRWAQITMAVGIASVAFLPQAVSARHSERPVNPFACYYADLSMGRMWYMHAYGPISHFCNECVNLAFRRESAPIPVTQVEVQPYIIDIPAASDREQGNLLFIFFESLEYWAIGLQVNGAEVTPNLNRLIAGTHTACYPMHAQVRQGKSSDAQLIALSGLLPIRNGAVSMRYAGNTFPSWVKAIDAPTRQMFTPCEPSMWNQAMLAEAFGFDSLYAKPVSDIQLADEVKHCIATSRRPFVLLMTTMASHSPFTAFADSVYMPEMPEYSTNQRNYLRCVHYTDSAIGRLLQPILTDSVLSSGTRIIITGDHPIFQTDTPVPFILYDPYESPVTAQHGLNQVDIYTTLVDRIGIATSWHGLGKNIADTTASACEEELLQLSDRLIRTNYFRQ